MNMLSVANEEVLESLGFVSTDESFLYAGFDDVVKGNLADYSVHSMNGETVYCKNEEEFIDELLSRAT